jgi:hypothetical protein
VAKLVDCDYNILAFVCDLLLDVPSLEIVNSSQVFKNFNWFNPYSNNQNEICKLAQAKPNNLDQYSK